ncbi:Response regulator PrrA [Variovorax sp. PBS-H4]|uniref:response regulator n=1 Tax=Variovorax sp. PBS-H4 TaxID=434008 RepID=UPI001315F53B|nr:response regulator [Variovorax sp. PBS-H4]VTU28756.1 Response regulator PrrA [Variovorax sp. PBS-H4]
MERSVFLVEDNQRIRQHLSSALEELISAQVAGTAESEAEACEWLASHPAQWQLAVVDLFLKQGSGLGVLAFCARRASSQRVVMLTNFATADTRARCRQLGADAIFDKSTELDDFFRYCADRTA